MCKFNYALCKNDNTCVCASCTKSSVLRNPSNYTPIRGIDYSGIYKTKNTDKQNALNRIIKKVIFNPPATIVYWYNGEKTVVKCDASEMFDPEKGLAMAFVKYFFNNHGYYNDVMKKFTEPYYKKMQECIRALPSMTASEAAIGSGEFTVKDIAKFYGISEDSVRRDIKKGCYPNAYKKNGKWIIVIKEEDSH